MRKKLLLKEFFGAWVLAPGDEKRIAEERKKFRKEVEEGISTSW